MATRYLKREINYDPLPSQKKFHDSKARFKGFSGPVGSGKSQALCQEAIRLSYLNPGRTGLLGAPTYPMLRDPTQATLLEILGANGVPYEHNRAENVIFLPDVKSRILFRPLDEYERLRGTNLAWFGLDELTYTPEEAWLRLEARLRDKKARRLCGFAVWTPKGFDWVYRKFITGGHKEDYEVIQAEPGENHHLAEGYYEKLKRSYDEKLYAQEVEGQYLAVDSGRAYSAFDRSIHVTDLQVNPHVPLLWALDFNYDPLCSVIVQIIGGKVLVLDEIVIRKAVTLDACTWFLDRYEHHPNGVVVYGDASGFQHRTSADTTDYDVIKRSIDQLSNLSMIFKVPPQNPPVRSRLNLMNWTLRSAVGDVGMLVDRKCNELIRDFEEVCLDGKGGIDKARDAARSHLSDALGYLVCQEHSNEMKIGPRGERIF